MDHESCDVYPMDINFFELLTPRGFFSFLIQRIRLIRNKFSNKFLAFCKIVLFEKFFFLRFFPPSPLSRFCCSCFHIHNFRDFLDLFCPYCGRCGLLTKFLLCEFIHLWLVKGHIGSSRCRSFIVFFFLLLLKSFKILQGFEIRIK